MTEKSRQTENSLQETRGRGLQNGTSAIQPAIDAWLGWLCLAAIITLAFFLNFHTLVDTDLFWHLKTGEIIYTTHRVPDRDIYSFTMAGREWIDAQWIFQLVIFLLYRFSGYAGMIAFAAILNSLTWALIIGSAFKPRKYFMPVFFGAACILAASIRLKLRPEILSFFYIALEIFLIGRFRKGEKYALYALPLILLLWVNSEGVWPIYFVVLSLFLFEEAVSRLNLPGSGYIQRVSPFPAGQSAAGLGICLLCSIPVAFINPYGLRGELFPLTLLREVSASGNYIHQTVNEFQSPFTHLTALDRDLYVGLIAISACFFLYLFYKRLLYPAAFLLWATFLFLSTTANRNLGLFAVITCGLTAMIMAENYNREIFPGRIGKINLMRLRPVAAAIVFIAAVFLIQDAASSRFFFRNGLNAKFGVGALETEYPIRAGNFLKSVLTEQGRLAELKIFADMESSGWFIWAGYPSWKVYFDPRLEVFGGRFLKNYVQALNSPGAFSREDQQYDFDAVAVTSTPSTLGLISYFHRDPKWSLVYLDGLSAIFLKNKPGLVAVAQKYRVDFSKGLESPLPSGLTGKWLAKEQSCRGWVLVELGHPALAIREYNQAIKLDPRYADAYNNLGAAYAAQGRLDLAMPNYNKSIELNPKQANAYYNRGMAYAAQGRFDPAIQEFNQAIKLDPQYADAYNNLGVAYAAQGRLDLAVKNYSKAIEINPDVAEPYINRALIYKAQGRPELAEKDFAKAIELNPEFANIIYK